jgi:hypothetical protein
MVQGPRAHLRLHEINIMTPFDIIMSRAFDTYTLEKDTVSVESS